MAMPARQLTPYMARSTKGFVFAKLSGTRRKKARSVYRKGCKPGPRKKGARRIVATSNKINTETLTRIGDRKTAGSAGVSVNTSASETGRWRVRADAWEIRCCSIQPEALRLQA